LQVVYEDRHLLVVDKPAGLLTQPTAARERDTLLERAGRYLARTRSLVRPYVGIVHRLDADTSGVILLAVTPIALRPLQAIFREHAAERLYVALVEGAPKTASGTIDLPLVPDRGDGRRGVGRAPDRGERAVTHYKVIESYGGLATQLTCKLETGRTHQIRIHLAEIGHPLIGEPVYRSRIRPPFSIPFARQALHAHSLAIEHPLTGQALRFEAPLPVDMVELLAVLRQSVK
jgi:23S rRNA pseudouridine1911/1915/1917 synthase